MLGDCYSAEFFRDIKNNRIRSALTQIADETQEDLLYYESVLKDFGCTVIRPELDHNDSIMNYVNEKNGALHGRQGVPKSPLQPRDAQLIIGNTALITQYDHFSIADALKQYSNDTRDCRSAPLPEFKYNEIWCRASGDWPKYSDYKVNHQNKSFFKPHVWKELQDLDYDFFISLSSATVMMIGTQVFVPKTNYHTQIELDMLRSLPYFKDFDVNFHELDGHADGNFHPIKPGAILSLYDVQNYSETFPGWDVCYLPDQGLDKVEGFLKLKRQVSGKWWVPGQEDNSEFTHFVETWLNDWVGYVEETVFDVNVLVLDEHHVCVNNLNPTVVKFLKKHNMEPVLVPWRHRYFWDGGLHCITLDLYREGVQQDYFPERTHSIIDKEF